MIGLKKFRDWLFNRKGESIDVLYPPLINEGMLKEETFELRNGEQLELGIASVNDLGAIIRIQEACYNGEAPWGRIAVNNELRNRKNSFFLMLYHNAYAVAFVGLSSRENSLHVTNIATDPRYQKNGIASFFIQRIIEISEQLEKDEITLEVRMSNEGAKRLYHKLGFKDVRVKRNYYHNNGEDALDMVYFINEMNGAFDNNDI